MKLRMEKYTEDWDRLTNIDVRQYPRLVKRIKVGYKTDLMLDDLVVNRPPDDLRPPHVIQEQKLKERELTMSVPRLKTNQNKLTCSTDRNDG